MIAETRTSRAWSPWFVGAGIGILSWISFMFVGGSFSVAPTFEHWGALVGRFFAPSLQALESQFRIWADWRWAFVLGVPVGALLASYVSADRPRRGLPELWRMRFGDIPSRRYLLAFAGGIVMMIGAGLALGGTVEHGLGLAQLGVSSLIFLASFAIASALTAQALYGRLSS
jgi:hypothetical protein